MRGTGAFILAWLLICMAIFPVPAKADNHRPPSVSAQAAALIDVNSGRILWQKNGDQKMRIASLTKVMTAIVAIENGRLEDFVKVGKNAYGKEGSSIYLRIGEEMSLHHLLYGLMLRSGNDAAVAIAEHVGGSLDGFVFLMNQKAQFLGMSNTHFANPHGLDQQGHFSTARDMAVLTAYALKNPVFQDIVKTKVKRVPNSYEKWDHVWHNKNKMLFMYKGADGVKTGYTKISGRCLISSATRNGQQLAVVTLNAPSDWADHTLLLNYGFSQFPLETLVQKGEPIGAVPLAAGATFRYPLTEQEKDRVSQEIALHSENSLDYRLGERGKLIFYLDQRPIGSVPLYDPDSVWLRLRGRPAYMDISSKEKWTFSDVFSSVAKSVFTGR